MACDRNQDGRTVETRGQVTKHILGVTEFDNEKKNQGNIMCIRVLKLDLLTSIQTW